MRDERHRPTEPRSVDVRIFWEGVLFEYAERLQINDHAQQASCSMTIPASANLHEEELYGTQLHVFYRMPERMDEEDPGHSGASEWPILFQGDLQGVQSSDQVSRTQRVVQFKGYARHFKQSILFHFNIGGVREQSGQVTQQASIDTQTAFLGNTKVKFDVQGILSRTTDIWESLQEFSQSRGQLDDATRNIGFQMTMLDLMRNARSRHPYLEYIDSKLSLSSRFGAYVDPDVGNLLDLTSFDKMMGQRTKALPSNTSLMQLLNMVNTTLKYDWNQLTQPQLHTVDANSSSSQQSRDPFRQKIESTAARLFDAQPEQSTSERNAVSTPFGVVNANVMPRASQTLSYRQFVQGLRDALQNRNDTQQALQTFIQQYRFANDASVPEGETNASRVDPVDQQTLDYLKSRQELNEFMVTPDMTFAQPPKCNVIPPGGFQSFNIQRNFMQEPTRLIGKIKHGTETWEWYIAPFSQSYYKFQDRTLRTFHPAYQEFRDNFGEFQLQERQES